MSLAAVHDLREYRPPASAQELEQFEVDVLAGYVLARSSAGIRDRTIRGEVGYLERVREWLGRALWEMKPAARGRRPPQPPSHDRWTLAAAGGADPQSPAGLA
jgi:hypothetical protein